ncbi:GNAT family N-acetyltransferase [Marinomonas balearica]|uniref:Phosphinothricin acetyltransferase n=1 Tax=Marinomonas balearica TaxID=491947 RepID=A0A4R6MAY7_9GAMM|nr:GNAT family N-acetyltransferase [Marinomonas balearica]TDO98738.1 phosphinothricin acetyltransferase [Marinomonas balearica]
MFVSEQNVIQVRHARLDDAPFILDIYQQHIAFDDITLVTAISWIEQATEQRPVWVATYENEIVGWCSLEPYYGLKAFDHVAELGLYIAKKWRRNGVGKTLIKKIEHDSHDLNLSTIVVNIFSGNTSSIQFFEQQNFSHYGVVPNAVKLPHNDLENMVIMGVEFTQ